MLIIKDTFELASLIMQWRSADKTIGFVPTMGALHSGHLSLIAKSLSQTDVTVVSIFVNPTQFGPTEDLARYPRPIETDMSLLSEAGIECLFLPSLETLYPRSINATTRIEVPRVSRLWCGKSRPHHFQGVCMILNRLLNLINPHFLYLGEKDFQQWVIVKTMVEDLFIPVNIVGCPIVRESDGLAMSSRNQYLTFSERGKAPLIYQALQSALNLFQEKNFNSKNILDQAKSILKLEPFIQLEYLALIDPNSLNTQRIAKENDRIIFAGRLGKTRLIDNIALFPRDRLS